MDKAVLKLVLFVCLASYTKSFPQLYPNQNSNAVQWNSGGSNKPEYGGSKPTYSNGGGSGDPQILPPNQPIWQGGQGPQILPPAPPIWPPQPPKPPIQPPGPPFFGSGCDGWQGPPCAQQPPLCGGYFNPPCGQTRPIYRPNAWPMPQQNINQRCPPGSYQCGGGNGSSGNNWNWCNVFNGWPQSYCNRYNLRQDDGKPGWMNRGSQGGMNWGQQWNGQGTNWMLQNQLPNWKEQEPSVWNSKLQPQSFSQCDEEQCKSDCAAMKKTGGFCENSPNGGDSTCMCYKQTIQTSNAHTNEENVVN